MVSHLSNGPVVVVSSFDGYHLSHRRLLAVAHQLTRLRRTQLHAVVLDDSTAIPLTPPFQRAVRLVRAGASSVSVIEHRGSGCPAATKVACAVLRRFRDCTHVLLAPTEDGSVDLSTALSRAGAQTMEVPRAEMADGARVSSGRIVRSILAGDMVAATAMGGESYSLHGTVVRGSGLGRTIGFPTANLELTSACVVPMRGVYAGIASTHAGSTACAINIGVRPTIAAGLQETIEAHLIGFDGDLYGRSLRLRFVQRLREERKFGSVDELTAQLQLDIAAARRLCPRAVPC